MDRYEEILYDLCEDCVQAYANDDFSALDYWCQNPSRDEKAIREGLDREFGNENFVGLDIGDEPEITVGCDCCKRWSGYVDTYPCVATFWFEE